MTNAEFKTYHSALLNERCEPFLMRDKKIRVLMHEIPVTEIQLLWEDGTWEGLSIGASLHEGVIYRVDPSWDGPAEPAEPPKPPTPQYVDKKPFCLGRVYFVNDPRDNRMTLEALKPGYEDVLGFIYGQAVEPSIRLECIRDDTTRSIGFEIVIPDAVRFRK